MTTTRWLVLDLGLTVLAVVGWYAAAWSATRRHLGPMGVATLLAVMLTAARSLTVGVLAGRGWWFVQEKVVLTVPLASATALLAAVLAGRLAVAGRRSVARPSPACVAALLGAGHGALTGLVVSLGVGYPLEWSTGLIAVGLWGAACLGTRWLVSQPGPRLDADEIDARRSAEISRRRLLGASGAALLTATAGGAGVALRSRPDPVTGGGPGPRAGAVVPVTQLRGASTPAPGGATVRHALTARRTRAVLASGDELPDAWTYNDQMPGPALVATQGDLIEVMLHNDDIEDGVTLHWHGYDVPCAEDGAPGTTQRAVEPGGRHLYRFRAEQVGTYWYHTHQASHIGVRKGLYGTLVVHPRAAPPGGPDGVDLTLPLHTFDGILLVGDRSGPTDHPVPAGQQVRLRVINTDSEPHRLRLVGATYRVAAVDGRDLNGPDDLREVTLRLPAGGRYDLVLAMPPDPVGLVIDGNAEDRVGLHPDGDTDHEPDMRDVDGWPELDLLGYGTPAPTHLDDRRPDRRFTIVLDRGVAMVDGVPGYAHTVNGLAHPSIPDQLVRDGDVVRFTVVNRSFETHPWHLHGHPVLVRSRNGVHATGSPLWLDTFDVRPGEVWEVLFEATNPGVWMNHCHNLPHADQGMMLRLAYDGIAPVAGSEHAH